LTLANENREIQNLSGWESIWNNLASISITCKASSCDDPDVYDDSDTVSAGARIRRPHVPFSSEAEASPAASTGSAVS